MKYIDANVIMNVLSSHFFALNIYILWVAAFTVRPDLFPSGLPVCLSVYISISLCSLNIVSSDSHRSWSPRT